MENIIDPSTYRHFLILNGRKLEADVAYAQIYGMAKKSLLVVDNYVDFKTNSEKLFHCGASSKDAGNKITIIVQLDDIEAYRNMFKELYDRYRMLRTMQQLSADMTLDEINAEIAAVRSGK